MTAVASRLGLRVVLLLAPLFAVGCIEFEQVLEVRPDGSGTLRVTLRAERTVLSRVRSQMAVLSDPQATASDPFDIAVVKAAVAKAKGARLLSLARIEDPSHVGLRVAVAFESVAALHGVVRAMLRGDKDGARNQLQLWFVEGKGNRIQLVYYPSGLGEHRKARQRAERQAAVTPAVRARQAAVFARMRKAYSMDTLKVVHRIKVPGQIIAVDGLKSISSDTAELTIRGKDIKTLLDMSRAAAPRFAISFDGRGCSMKRLAREPVEASSAISRSKKDG